MRLRWWLQLVLVGDHCQLPPTVASREAEADGLGISLFDRLVTAGERPFLLEVCHTMSAYPCEAQSNFAKYSQSDTSDRSRERERERESE